MKPLNKNEAPICQARQKKCHYYKNIVKRHLNEIKEHINLSKNDMERSYYRSRSADQLRISDEVLGIQEKYIERYLMAR